MYFLSIYIWSNR